MNKQDTVRAWCVSRIGCPYVYGGTGQPCTVAYRQARAAQYPNYAEKIKRNCQRMSGKASACQGCVWADPETGKGRDAYDCAQFSKYAMEAVGIPMVSGANSQWERTDWAFRGNLAAGYPEDEVFLVFRRDTDHMGHVGVYLGDGTVTHAKGHDWGVVREKLADTAFTHWGQPQGLLTDGPIRPVLRKGASGAAVTLLQTLLREIGETLTVDGHFGSQTEQAVKRFQRAHDLTVDGVVGPKTWAAMVSIGLILDQGETVSGPDQMEQTGSQQDAHQSKTSDAARQLPQTGAPRSEGEGATLTGAEWAAIRAAVAVLRQIIQKQEEVACMKHGSPRCQR